MMSNWAAMWATSAVHEATTPPAPNPPVQAVPTPAEPTEPGVISAAPIVDPDLGRPHVQAPTMPLPPNAYTIAADLKKRVAHAKTIVERELPPLIARIITAELDWLNNSTWSKSSGAIEAVLAEVESLETGRAAA